MKMIFKAFAKRLFGVKYERLPRTLLIDLVVFWGLHVAGLRVQIAPFILYLMTGTVTAGVMWQTLFSKDNAANMQNMFMLPFDGRKFVFSYVAALGVYAFLTKTAALLAILLAVSVWNFAQVAGSVLCAINAILMAAAIYSFRKHWYVGGLWGTVVIAAIWLLGNQPWLLPFLLANGMLAVLCLQGLDGYSFYTQGGESVHVQKGHRRASVWRYLFRYLKCHKNYLANTVIMWGVAVVLPLFFKRIEGLFVVPIGFAILSLNTPICILMSCDPASQQAVRFLPGQRKAFCLPYCLFIFLCNLVANVIFLISLQIQGGGVTVLMIVAALFFALQSAICSVLLEWFYPVRDWKIESDLWHHPRKYIVPVTMLLLAGVVGTMPVFLFVLVPLLAEEVAALLFWTCAE